MKKIFVLFFLLITACAFAEPLGIWNIKLGDKPEKAIKELKNRGWKQHRNENGYLSFMNTEGVYGGVKCSLICFNYNENKINSIFLYFFDDSEYLSDLSKKIVEKYQCKETENKSDVILTPAKTYLNSDGNIFTYSLKECCLCFVSPVLKDEEMQQKIQAQQKAKETRVKSIGNDL